VSVGNDAEIAGELQKAADAYRAAITMDSCSAFGWAALGTLAMRVNRPDQAIAALEVAIELQPSHYGAATDLGRAYEALGNRQRAIDAYRAALKARPGHPAASQGLARLGAS
jgi:protein O-GlcNAc transferase